MIVIHAVTLLLVALSPAILWFFRRSAPGAIDATFARKIVYVIPFLVIGCITSAILSVNGGLLSEWVIPAFVVFAAAFIAPTVRPMRIYSGAIFVICIGLCAEGLILRDSGHTSTPQFTSGASAAHQKAILNSIRHDVEKQALPAIESPRPLSELVEQEIPSIENVRVVTEWHTPVTGLFRIERRPQTIWVVGVDGTTPRLEARPL